MGFANTFLMVMEEFGINAAAAAKNAAEEGSPGTFISNGCKGVDNGFMEIVPFDETGAPNSFNIISE